MKLQSISLLLFTGFMAVAFSACSPNLSPFTERLYKENGWRQAELSSIQFYLSRDVILQREVSEGNTTIKSGKIKTKNGRLIEEVRIPRGTPGVLVTIKSDDPTNRSKTAVEKMVVSFEDTDDFALTFGPNPKQKGTYVLLADDWQNSAGKVHYGGQIYWAVNDSGLAALMIDLRKIQQTERKSRTARGRKLE